MLMDIVKCSLGRSAGRDARIPGFFLMFIHFGAQLLPDLASRSPFMVASKSLWLPLLFFSRPSFLSATTRYHQAQLIVSLSIPGPGHFSKKTNPALLTKLCGNVEWRI
jgi:hypothetical protein